MRIVPKSLNPISYMTHSRSEFTINKPIESSDSFEKSFSPKYQALSFHGVDGKGKVKQRGMLFHITSLPATRS